jgi:general secretion pathway protein A
MYQAFFGLREKPFNLTPDPKFLYLNASYREALAALHYGIAERKGFASLIGEAGTGKTTLLRRLLSELPRDTRSVLVINPAVGFEELLRFILTDLGRPPARDTSKLQMLEALNAELLDTLARGGNVVVLIDEAQDLTIPVLEELRLLSNLETAKEKILQFVLAGQPELDAMLARPEIRQLRQRIAVNARLRPLGRAEMRAYVAARIAAAGGDERGLFRPAALYRLWRFSHGVPRLVNVACDNALVSAYAAGKRTVGWKAIGEAIRDLRPSEGAVLRVPWSRLRMATIAVAAVFGAGVGLGMTHLAGRPGPTNDEVHAPAPARREPIRQPERVVPPVAKTEPRAAVEIPPVAVAPPPVEVVPAPALVPEPAPAAAEAAAAPAETAPRAATHDEVPAAAAAAAEEQAAPANVAPAPAEPESVEPAPAPEPQAALQEQAVEPQLPAEQVAARITRERLIRVTRGDTLTAIAMTHYGYVSTELVEAIKRANPGLRDPDVIMTGGSLVLPPDVATAPAATTAN